MKNWGKVRENHIFIYPFRSLPLSKARSYTDELLVSVYHTAKRVKNCELEKIVLKMGKCLNNLIFIYPFRPLPLSKARSYTDELLVSVYCNAKRVKNCELEKIVLKMGKCF